MSLAVELKRIRNEAGLTMIAFGERLGVSKSYVAQLEAGERSTISFEFAAKICKAFNLPMDHFVPILAPGLTVPPPPGNVVQVEGHTYPLVGTVGAGELDQPEVYEVPFSYRTAERYAAGTIALRVVGHSCEPRIPHGAIVIVEPADKPEEGKFHVVQSAIGHTLKLYEDGKLYRLGPTKKPIRLTASTRLVGIVRRAELPEP